MPFYKCDKCHEEIGDKSSVNKLDKHWHDYCYAETKDKTDECKKGVIEGIIDDIFGSRNK